ncbi:MAG: hypothetical protein GF418_15935 [Chitinivibrionales bacterium]|nr:hypothetical protein [Chitinivibrionales bacterium]
MIQRPRRSAGRGGGNGTGTDDRGRITLSSQQAHSGGWSAYMPAEENAGYQGASLDWRACDGEQQTNCALRSFDQLYFRVWIRFADDHRYVHHFLNVGGSQPAVCVSRWRVVLF